MSLIGILQCWAYPAKTPWRAVQRRHAIMRAPEVAVDYVVAVLGSTFTDALELARGTPPTPQLTGAQRVSVPPTRNAYRAPSNTSP